MDETTQPPAGDLPTLDDVVEPQVQPEAPAATANLLHLWQAQALPEAPADEPVEPLAYEPGSIEQFMDADGRTMRVVSVAGALHKTPAPVADTQEQ